jgi:hypothetical protein
LKNKIFRVILPNIPKKLRGKLEDTPYVIAA